MRSLVANELLKTFSKWRSSIAFIAIAVIVPLVHVALRLQGDAALRSLARGLTPELALPGGLLNGYFVTYIVMNTLWLHIPFLITLGAGDQLAGEATGGTFRLMLIRPVSRTRLVMAKYLTTLLYTCAVVTFLYTLSLLLGVALFGVGDVLIPGRALVVIPESEALWRIGTAFLLSVWGMWTVASLAFLFSSLVENGIGPIVGTMAVIMVFYVIGNIPVDLFRDIRPYLFTTYLSVWQRAMEQPIDLHAVLLSVLILGAFSVGFLAATWYIFSRKDILS